GWKIGLSIRAAGGTHNGPNAISGRHDRTHALSRPTAELPTIPSAVQIESPYAPAATSQGHRATWRRLPQRQELLRTGKTFTASVIAALGNPTSSRALCSMQSD